VANSYVGVTSCLPVIAPVELPLVLTKGELIYVAKKISNGVVHEVPADLERALTSDPQALTAWEDITPLARNEWICWIESKKQKPEAVGWGGPVQALRMENDAPVVGPDAPTANSKMVKLDIATADWSRPTSGLRVNHF